MWDRLRLQEAASEVRFVYTLPGQLETNKSFLSVLKHERARQRLQRVVLDEAHCVGMWGNTFRCGAFAAMQTNYALLWCQSRSTSRPCRAGVKVTLGRLQWC